MGLFIAAAFICWSYWSTSGSCG